MGLFSFGKKKQEEQKNFNFLIKDIFALEHSMGVLLLGQVTEGIIHEGDCAVCLPGAGDSFLCSIRGIGYVDHETKERFYLKEARADGPSGGLYILMTPGRHKSDFRAGDRLVPAGSVPVDEPAVMTPRPCKGFLFHIKDIFSIKDVGTALVGTVLNGSAGIGDEVSFGHVPGEAVFTCKIKSIDGKTSMDGDIGPAERATGDGACRYGWSLTVDEPESRRFRVGEYLFIL